MPEPAAPFLDAIRGGNRQRAFAEADAALAQSGDLGYVYLEVLQPAMREVGRLWQHNEITVGEEHLATAITQAAMARLFERAFDSSSNEEGPTLLAACAEDERHQIGLRMLCDLLELEGWRTHYLGPSVPVESLPAMVDKMRPDVVALSAAITPHLTQLQRAIAVIRAAPNRKRPLIMVGGRAFNGDSSLSERIGADLFASDARSAVLLLRSDVRLRSCL